MAHDVLPPQPGPWRRSEAPEHAGPPSSGAWFNPGAEESGAPRRAKWFNPYAPPSERADRSSVVRPVAPSELRLASPGQRLLARLIDAVLLALALAPGVAVQLSWDTEIGVGLWTLALLAMGVFQWAMTATSGQTLGKRWTGLRLIKENGERVGFFRGVFLRVWVMWIGSLLTSGGVLLVLDPLFVFSKQRRSFRDHLSSTLVIVADTPGDPYWH
jgi:uncharacterized RDD family membrane protein YckC